MSTRIQRLATDWKTYVAVLAGLGSLLEAITGVFTKLTQLSEGATHAPVETRWVAVALLAIVATLALFSVLSRRSAGRLFDKMKVEIDPGNLLMCQISAWMRHCDVRLRQSRGQTAGTDNGHGFVRLRLSPTQS